MNVIPQAVTRQDNEVAVRQFLRVKTRMSMTANKEKYRRTLDEALTFQNANFLTSKVKERPLAKRGKECARQQTANSARKLSHHYR